MHSHLNVKNTNAIIIFTFPTQWLSWKQLCIWHSAVPWLA